MIRSSFTLHAYRTRSLPPLPKLPSFFSTFGSSTSFLSLCGLVGRCWSLSSSGCWVLCLLPLHSGMGHISLSIDLSQPYLNRGRPNADERFSKVDNDPRWSPQTVSSQCQIKTWLSHAGISMVFDIMLILLPIPLVKKMQIPMKQKLLTLGLFAIGSAYVFLPPTPTPPLFVPQFILENQKPSRC